MPGFPVAHRRAPAALVAPLLAALVAGALPLPAAGGAATSPEPNVRVRVEPRDGRTATAPVPPAADATTDAPPEQPVDRLPRGDGARGRRDHLRAGRPRHGRVQPAGVGSLAGRRQGAELAARGSRDRSRDGGLEAGEPLGGHRPGLDPPAILPPIPPPSPDPPPTDAPATPDATPAPVDEPSGDEVVAADGASFAQPVEQSVDLAAASGLRRQVYGFLPYWSLSGASSKLNYDVLSTIAYFSVGASAKGDLKKKDPDGSNTTGWGGWTSSSMTSVINAAHQRGTRVVLTISVFAWSTSQANVQKAILGSAAARSNLAKQAAAAVRDRGADGINLDFEPLASGYADEFVLFLKAVRTELNRVKAGYQLTYDTTGFVGNYPLEASVGAGAADAIFVMGYDYRTSGSSTAGSIDPLTGPKYDLTDTVRTYTARVAPSRVILGLPWYGRAWSTTSSAVRAPNQSGTKFGTSSTPTYENIVGLVAQYGRRWDPVEQSPYVAYQRQNCTSTYGCVTSWRQVYYEDGPSLKLRLGMVNDYGLRGAGMWALGNDGGHPELYRAFAESFLVDKSAPQAGVRSLPGALGDEGFVVTWAASDTSSIASFDVQVSTNGGAWAAWLTGTKATSEVWLGKDGAGYAFRVRARDAKGNTGTWNVTSVYDATPSLAPGGFGRVVTDGLAYRTGPGTSAAKLGHAGRRHDRRRHPRARERRRLHLVRGHPADHRVEPGGLRRARRVDRRALVDGEPRRTVPGPQRHARGRRHRRLRLRDRAAARSAAPRARRRPGRSRPTATAPRT